MSGPDERRRIQDGPVRGEQTRHPLVTIVAVGDGRTLRGRLAEVFQTIASANADDWANLEFWRVGLPDWYIRCFAPDETEAQFNDRIVRWRAMSADDRARASAEIRWTLTDWLYWMNPDHRQWFIWSASPERARLVVMIEAMDYPLAWGALRWLLKSAGSTSITSADN